MIRNNNQDDTFITDITGFTRELAFSKDRTAYVNWESVKTVQIGRSLINSPNDLDYVTALSPNFVTASESSSQIMFLDQNNVTDTFQKLCSKFNTSLDLLITPLVAADADKRYFGWYSVVPALAGLIISIILMGAGAVFVAFKIKMLQLQVNLIVKWDNQGRVHQAPDLKRRKSTPM